MNKILLATLVLSLLSCGKKRQESAPTSEAAVPLVGQVVTCNENGFEKTEDLSEVTVKVQLYKDLVLRVLSELSGSGAGPEQFWTSLSAEIREELIYHINLSLIESKTAASKQRPVLESAALYFFGLKSGLNPESLVKINDFKTGAQYGFKLRGSISSEAYANTFCENVSTPTIVIPKDIGTLNQITEVTSCLSANGDTSFTLMETTSAVYLQKNKKLLKLLIGQFTRKDRKKSVRLSFRDGKTRIKIRMSKVTDLNLDNWSGKKSRVRVKSEILKINGRASCRTRIRPLR